MNSYERYRGMVAGEAVDVVPRVPILMQYAAEYIGSNYGAFAADYTVLCAANDACVRDFNFDQVSCISDPYREAEGFGGAITYVEDGVPRCVPPLEADKDLDKLPSPDPMQSTRMRDRIEAARRFHETHAKQHSILGWIEGPAAEAADLRGVQNFLFDLMLDEAYAVELMDRCVANGIAFARAQIEAGADTIGIGDAIASQLSPDTYERLIQPREKQLVQAIQEAGALVKLHICGNITHLLPGIAQLGVDILDTDHMVDLVTAREAVGGNVTITGNVDPAGLVYSGDPGVIRAAVRDCYARAGNPYMVNAGCEIPSGTPEENLRALCEPIPYAQ